MRSGALRSINRREEVDLSDDSPDSTPLSTNEDVQDSSSDAGDSSAHEDPYGPNSERGRNGQDQRTFGPNDTISTVRSNGQDAAPRPIHRVPQAPPLECHNPNSPAQNADLFIENTYSHEDFRCVIRVRRAFYTWSDGRWIEVGDELFRSFVSRSFENAYFITDEGVEPFPGSDRALTNLMRWITDKTVVPNTTRWNTWIEPRDDDPNPKDLAVLKNGLFDVTTGVLHPHTPRFFNAHTAEFDYDPDAPRPDVWLAFVAETLEGDQERIDALQEWMGLVVTLDTSFQTMIAMIGESGGGKGTTLRMCRELVGKHNVGSPGLASLGGDFGLQGIATKPLIQLSDIQHMGRNGGLALERLVAISGEDELEVNVKGRDPYSTLMPGRIMMAANSVPRLPDKDGALQRRLLVLKYRKSFRDKADATLVPRMIDELPGIFNWALEGLARLRAHGKFRQPYIGEEDLELLKSAAAPVSDFLEECCLTKNPGETVGSDDARVAKDDLYTAWTQWAQQRGVKPSDRSSFMMAVHAKYPYVDGRQYTVKETPRRRAVVGLQLLDEARAKFLPSSWTSGP